MAAAKVKKPPSFIGKLVAQLPLFVDAQDNTCIAVDEFVNILSKSIPELAFNPILGAHIFDFIATNHANHVNARQYYIWRQTVTDKFVAQLEARYNYAKERMEGLHPAIDGQSDAKSDEGYQSDFSEDSIRFIDSMWPKVDSLKVDSPKVDSAKPKPQMDACEEKVARVPTVVQMVARGPADDVLNSRFDFRHYLKQKEEEKSKELAQELKREAEDEKKLRTAFLAEKFDLTLGVLHKENKVFKKNYRPMLYTAANIVCMILSLTGEWVSVVGVFLNAVVLVLGIFSQFAFNVMEVCCGNWGRRWFKYKPYLLHNCAMDAFFNIEALRERSAGLAMVGRKAHDICSDKPLEFAIGSLSPNYGFAQPVLEKLDTKTRLKGAHKLEKQRKKLADNQIVPWSFGYILVIGWLLVHSILLGSNRAYPKEGSWFDYNSKEKGTSSVRGLIRYSCVLVMVSFPMFCVFCSLVLYRNVRSKALTTVRVAQLALVAKFPGKAAVRTATVDTEELPGAATFLEKIEAKQLQISPPLTVSCVLFATVLICAPLLWSHGLYVGKLKASHWWALLIFLPSVALAIFTVSVLLGILWRIHNFYAIGERTMSVLGKPLHVSSVEHLMVWWETRKFFLCYQLPVTYIYGHLAVVFVVLVTLTSAGLILVKIFITPNKNWAVLHWVLRSPLTLSMIVLVILLCFAISEILKMILKVIKTQSAHCAMLRHELVRLDAYGSLFSRRIEETAAERQKEAIEKAASKRSYYPPMFRSSMHESGLSLHGDAAMDALSANAIIDAFQDAGHVTISMDDMKMEKRVANAGKDSHALILSMLHILEHMDVYPTVNGIHISPQLARTVMGTIYTIIVAVLVKAIAIYN